MRWLSAVFLALVGNSALAQAVPEPEQEIREIVRGPYLKGGIGTSSFLSIMDLGRTDGINQNPLAGVIAVELAGGADFIDRERFSAAWELGFSHALYAGPSVLELANIGPLVQGDVQTFTGTLTLEASTYLSRRLGLGIRAGGGVLFAPLLLAGIEYDAAIVNPLWGGEEASLHASPHPVVQAGPTLEYYTKLSHFSVGIDVDVVAVIGFDIALSPRGYLKYTF